MTTEEESLSAAEEEPLSAAEEESLSAAEEGYNVQRDYWRQAEESDGFDIENIKLPPGMHGRVMGLITYNCQLCYRYPFPVLVKLYAKFGLHRYNLIKGTSFELAALMKFNMLQNYMSSFYMTLLAHDPDPAASSSQKTFQVRVDEQQFGTLGINCSIARPKHEGDLLEVSTETPFMPHFHGGALGDGIFKVELPDCLSDTALNELAGAVLKGELPEHVFDDALYARAGGIFQGELPDWPTDDVLNDGKRFYLVKDSEWQATDWISMYLELVITTTDKSISIKPEVLSQLEIVKVAIETATKDEEPSNERLKAYRAHFYITFKGLAEPRAPRQVFEIGEHLERQAIVRRVMGHRGDLTLKGKLCGGQYIKKRSLALKRGKKSQKCKTQALVD
ncbi:Protein MS5 [Arabidopsis suecica]|uniref:Protein MS5 n=1 Tax=Arabidopsis suecica TaxID=45249 RepID=A0A8T2H8K0_ARASU|nr:Protein MS5 [Arabidopsis suecica]